MKYRKWIASSTVAFTSDTIELLSALIPHSRALPMQVPTAAKRLPQQVDFYRLVAPIDPGKVRVENHRTKPQRSSWHLSRQRMETKSSLWVPITIPFLYLQRRHNLCCNPWAKGYNLDVLTYDSIISP